MSNRKRKPNMLTPEQIKALKQERDLLWQKIFAIDEEAERYVQSILDSVGNKPIVRNPHPEKNPMYDIHKSMRFFEDNPWFWEIKDDDEPKLKAMKAALRHTFIYEYLLTPEEDKEVERILAKADSLERRIDVIDKMLSEGLTEEEAEAEVAEEEREEKEGGDAVLFV
jgi:hypothetical protein